MGFVIAFLGAALAFAGVSGVGHVLVQGGYWDQVFVVSGAVVFGSGCVMNAVGTVAARSRAPGARVACEECGELVLKGARRCPHCQSERSPARRP